MVNACRLDPDVVAASGGNRASSVLRAKKVRFALSGMGATL
jgi:hypothetical protein